MVDEGVVLQAERLAMSARLQAILPKGTPIGEHMFAARHRAVVVLLWLHVAGLGMYGIAQGYEVPHLALELSATAAAALIAGIVPHRLWRAGVGTLGLVTCSAILVHLSGGLIEAHFHFFIVVILVTLYQSWVPFLLALLFVVIHHGTVGVIDPGSVYAHAAAVERPWLWAFVHGVFIAGAALAAMVAWKHVETERDRAEAAAVRLHDRTVRHREAMELNDTIVQGLVAAKYATELGRDDVAAETIARTLDRAQHLVADLMDDESLPFEPGTLRRVRSAGVTAAP